MSEKLTKSLIIDALRGIGIEKGMELEVHSSLSSFGYVEGGAETVISALKECCGEAGSIFMPSLRLSKEIELTDEDRQLGVFRKIKILPEDCDRTAMGTISDTFRKQSDTKTGPGIFRISGWGRNAEEAVRGGLDYIINTNGKALLLGVDIYKLTAMHYVEDLLPKKVKDIFTPTEKVNTVYPPNQWLIEMGEPPVKAWYTIQKKAYEKGLIKEGLIGKCKVMFFDTYDILEIYKNELLKNPLKLYGLEG